MGMLTVRENIEFSASLRLPSGTSAERRKEIVEGIISDLGLSNCAKTKVRIYHCLNFHINHYVDHAM